MLYYPGAESQMVLGFVVHFEDPFIPHAVQFYSESQTTRTLGCIVHRIGYTWHYFIHAVVNTYTEGRLNPNWLFIASPVFTLASGKAT